MNWIYPELYVMPTRPLVRRADACRARWPAFRKTAVAGVAARSAWLAGALFVLAGLAVLDDYGVGEDAARNRYTASLNLDYVLGRSETLLSYQYRLYSVAFELPLLLAERLLNLQDSRAIYLGRHLLTHLLFLAGGLACAALAFRLYRNRLLALCALSLFLLHPRLYAHSFFNAKDLPFLSLFMLTLLLIHRAFRRETGAAFALCGAGIGLLTGLRLTGLLLCGAVLALRTCDFVGAADWAVRRRILGTGGLFVLTCALALYAASPYFWGDPVTRFVEVFAYMSKHPRLIPNLFRETLVLSREAPAYVPVWFAITAPPGALLLGAAGAAALVQRGLRAPGALVRNTRLRFEGLLLACCILPTLAVILLGATLYNGWRHLYFLYAPFCLLATDGLRALAAGCRRGRGGAGWAYGLAGWTATATLGAMVALHPDQHLYFNFLEDRATPERLRIRYDFDYWEVSYRKALEFLLAQYPEGPLYVHAQGSLNREILPATDRQRIVIADAGRADFHIAQYRAWWQGAPPYAPVIHARKVYGNTVFAVTAANLERTAAAVAAPYRAAYRALSAGAPVVRDRFDVYVDAQAVRWVRTPCGFEDAAPRFVLHVTPMQAQDLPANQRGAGFDNLSFDFAQRGVRVDGACLAVAPLPAYPIQHVRVGQWLTGEKRMLWQADVRVPPASPAARAYGAAYRTLAPQTTLHQGPFAIYVTRSTVTLARAPCTEADIQPRFLLHALPANPRDLTGLPFADRGFHFFARGVRVADACLAAMPLPAWPLRYLAVGQQRPEAERTLWQVDLPLLTAPRAADAYRAAYRDLMTVVPAHRGIFDVYVMADAVAYAKAPCAEADTQPRFILHVVPVRARDLPPNRRRAGFANRDFEFAWQGAHFDGACLARATLPAYPVARVRVGQFRPGADPLWLAEIPLAR